MSASVKMKKFSVKCQYAILNSNYKFEVCAANAEMATDIARLLFEEGHTIAYQVIELPDEGDL